MNIKTGGDMQNQQSATEKALQRGTSPNGHGGSKPEHREGPVAETIENQTAKVPSDIYLWASVGAMATSAILQLLGKRKVSLFFGQWVAPVLIMGLYNKIVKVAGHD
jgi:hypothetical protein